MLIDASVAVANSAFSTTPTRSNRNGAAGIGLSIGHAKQAIGLRCAYAQVHVRIRVEAAGEELAAAAPVARLTLLTR
eukprot:1780320-Prymnesium_polylepis.3